MLVVGEPVPASLGNAELVAADGARRSFAELCAKEPALAFFLRHFGCIGCAEQVHELRPRLGELGRLGVSVLLVGSGPPAHIPAFVERNDLASESVTVVSDPSLAAYRAAGLGRSVWATYGPRAAFEFGRALANGHRPRATDGDLLQQGGAVLVAGGVVRWARASASLGDHGDPSDAIDVALAIASARARGAV